MRKSKVLCAHCDAKVTSARSFCANCKQPTMFASLEERTAWELEQWAQKRGTSRKRVVGHGESPAAKPKRAPTAATVRSVKPEPLKRAAAAALPPQRNPRPRIKPVKPKPGKLDPPKAEPVKVEKARLERSKATRASEPLIVDLRDIDRPRNVQEEQVELLRELLDRVTSIEAKLNGNGARMRRLRLLKR